MSRVVIDTRAKKDPRGAPKGLKIVRISFGMESPDYDELVELARSKGIKVSEYCKKLLVEHTRKKRGLHVNPLRKKKD